LAGCKNFVVELRRRRRCVLGFSCPSWLH